MLIKQTNNAIHVFHFSSKNCYSICCIIRPFSDPHISPPTSRPSQLWPGVYWLRNTVLWSTSFSGHDVQNLRSRGRAGGRDFASFENLPWGGNAWDQLLHYLYEKFSQISAVTYLKQLVFGSKIIFFGNDRKQHPGHVKVMQFLISNIGLPNYGFSTKTACC